MVCVRDFSVSLFPYEKLIGALWLLFQDYGMEEKEYRQLKEVLEKYVNVEEFFEKFPEIKDTQEWLSSQPNLAKRNIAEVWEEVKPFLFQYVANLMVDKDGYFDCYAISAYKKICKILIEENAFEYLDQYSEGLRICKGKLREEFLKRYRYNEKPNIVYEVIVEGILGKKSKNELGGIELTDKEVQKIYRVNAFSEREAKDIALKLAEKDCIVSPKILKVSPL